TWSFLHDRLYQGYAAATPVGTEEAAQAAHLGLTVSGGSLGNGTKPAQDLIRPGATASSLSHLMRFQSSTNARFWVFGSDGRPIEPGAAASWWKYLTTDGAGAGDGFTNLWAPGIESANQRTAIPSSGAEDLRTIHLTNAHG